MKQILTLSILMIFLSGCSSKMEVIKARMTAMSEVSNIASEDVYTEKASGFFEKNQFDSTLIYCHKAYSVDPENWEVSYLYGLTAMRMYAYEKADLYLNRALTLCKNKNDARAELYFALGDNADAQNHTQSARQHYMMVVQLSPDSELGRTASQKIKYISILR